MSRARSQAGCVLGCTAILLLYSGAFGPARAAAGPAWTIEAAPNWLAPIDPAAPAGSADAASVARGCRHLLYDHQVRVTDHQVEHYTRWVREIVNETGLRSTSQINVEFDATFQVLALHSINVIRGAKTLPRLEPTAVRIVQREHDLEKQIYDGRQSAVVFLDDLRVGDVVEFAYTVRGADPTLGGRYADALTLGLSEPIERLHARLVFPHARRLRVALVGADQERDELAPVQRRAGDDDEYVWDLRKLKAYPPHAEAPRWYQAYPWVQLSEFESWSDVASWGRRLFDVKPNPAGAVHAWARQTLAAAHSPDEFILRAIRFVQDEIRYVGIEVGMARRQPANPDLVFERRFGDCKDKATLLVTMLREGGIAADPALVSTAFGPELDRWAPSPNAFNHVIVRLIGTGDQVYWADATVLLQGGGLDRLRFSSLRSALPLADGTRDLEPLAEAPVQDTSYVIKDHFVIAKPDTKDETYLDSERIYHGTMADDVRAESHSMSAAEFAKHYLDKYQPDFPGIRESAKLEQSDDRERNELRVVAHFAIPRLWSWRESEGCYAASFFPVGWERLLRAPPSTEAVPIAWVYPLQMRYEISVDLPFDLTPTSADVHASGPAFDYHVISDYEHRRLHYAYDLVSRTKVVLPSQRDAHAEAVDRVAATFRRTITHRKRPADGPNWSAIVAALGCVPFLLFLTYRVYRYEPRASAAPRTGDARVIGGWLAPLGFSLLALPVYHVRDLISAGRLIFSRAQWTALTTPGLSNYKPELAVMCVADFVVEAGLLAYSCAVVLLFFRRKRLLRLHFAAYVAAFVAYLLCDYFTVIALDASSVRPGSWIRIANAVLWGGAWSWYLARSRRAAETFVF
jgi:hypothetical protein